MSTMSTVAGMDISKHVQTAVRHVGAAEVGLYGAKGEIGALSLSGTDTVEESGFTDVRKTDYTAFQ